MQMSNPSILLPAFDVITMCHISWGQLARKLLLHLLDFYSHANKASFNTIQLKWKQIQKANWCGMKADQVHVPNIEADWIHFRTDWFIYSFFFFFLIYSLITGHSVTQN